MRMQKVSSSWFKLMLDMKIKKEELFQLENEAEKIKPKELYDLMSELAEDNKFTL